ncbi:MAG: acetyl-CoA carboxylase carboxyltransferase subunit alpha [Planctomycetes bacterium]|nr:acetyl-CoA carboxylase carboxyltransferase subunit alpha [Planctomycetota bacterium]
MGNNPSQEFEQPIYELERKIAELEAFSARNKVDLSTEISIFRARLETVRKSVFAGLTAWQRVQLARDKNRPLSTDYIHHLFSDFVELHGDRAFADDAAIVTGFGRINGHKVLLVGHRKGKTTRERSACNFGSAHPEGYRKALLKMRLAEKFRLPIVCLIDTPGAYPGIGAEERGQSSAIAVNLLEMSRLQTPIVCIVIGEGGSGGALGIGVGDRLSIMENAYFSVISPEGCAAILWKDGAKASFAAEVLKLTPRDLHALGIMDEIIPEPPGGAHRDHAGAAANLRSFLMRTLDELCALPMEALLQRRYERHRRIGKFLEGEQTRVGSAPSPAAARPAGTA